MINLETLDTLANKLCQALPDSLKDVKADMTENFKTILQSAFTHMNLVTREEFDRQTALLEKAHEKLDQLKARLDEHHKKDE